MGLILRTTLTPNSGNSLSIKGTALSYVEGDGNFMYLLTNMSGSNISITGSTGILGNTTITGNLNVNGTVRATSTIYANNLAGVVYNTASVGDVRLIGDNIGNGLDGGDYILKTGIAYYGNVMTDSALTYFGFNSGSGTSNFIAKYKGSTTLGNSLIYDNGTNVGINITSPTALLHVVGTLSNGNNTTATGSYSHAEGNATQAKGVGSHAEGINAISSGSYSHAEGYNTLTLQQWSHAEGNSTLASGISSHAEGTSTVASGVSSHAEGYFTTAMGDYSHSTGFWTVASGSYQSVIGQYNISSSAQSAFIVGNGTSEGSRSNLIFASGSQVQVTGSVNISDVLVLPFQSPLPSNKPTGSVAISGSGGTFVGMFVYNGTSWTNVKA
jgi:hypothetical protein